MNEPSFYACLARLQDAMPASWSGTVKHVTQVLFRYSKMGTGGGIRASIPTIAKACGESERTVQRVQKFLRKGGFMIEEGTAAFRNAGGPIFIPVRRLMIDAILAQKKLEENPGDMGANADEAVTTDDDGGVTDDTRRKEDATGLTPGGVRDCAGGVSNRAKSRAQDVTQSEPYNQTLEPNETPNGVSRVRAREAMFLAFWSHYPRKQGQLAARRAWYAALREHDPAMILAAVQRHAFSSDPQFVPMPARWLWDERFMDEEPDDGIDPTLLAAGLTREQILAMGSARL